MTSAQSTKEQNDASHGRTIGFVLRDLGTSAPAGLTTRDFVVRPLLGSDAELDYDAVMESRAFLAWAS